MIFYVFVMSILHQARLNIMRVLTFVVTLALSLSPSVAQYERAAGLKAGVERFFVRAIVKIDVSSKKSVIRGSENICVSQGTGFLVSANHVITADHVVSLPSECGERIILLRSRAYKLERAASVVAAEDDVALLKVDAEFPTEMCALSVNPKIEGDEAIRYGIPGKFNTLPPPSPLTLNKGDEFLPFIHITPTFTEKGESGGPVIQIFHVIGMTRARHTEYPAHSFMIPGSIIRALLDRNPFKSGRICNPFAVEMTQGSPGSVDFFGDISGRPKNVEVRITIDRRMIPAGSGISPELIQSYLSKSTDPSISISWHNEGATIRVGFGSPTEYFQALDKVYRSVNDLLQTFQGKLWAAYKLEKEDASEVVAQANDRRPPPVTPPPSKLMQYAMGPVERSISLSSGMALQRALCVAETGAFDSATRAQLRNFNSASLYPTDSNASDKLTSDADLARLRAAQRLYPSCRGSGFKNGFEEGLFARFGGSRMRADLKLALEGAGLPPPDGLNATGIVGADDSIRNAVGSLRAKYNLPGEPVFDRAFYDAMMNNLIR
jgi:hypothetical protein